MNFPFYIARRYIITSSTNNAINVITKIAGGGIIVGAMALFVVLSVFSGLRDFSMSFSNSADPDLKITATAGKSFLVSSTQDGQLRQISDITAASKVIEERVLFTFSKKEKVAFIKGVDSVYENVVNTKKVLFNGQWLVPNTYQAVVGYGIADNLSMGLFDFNNVLTAYAPKPGKGAIDNPNEAFNTAELVPIGIYAISEELDSKYVFVDLGLTQELLQYKPNQISGIEIKLKTGANEKAVIEKLNTIFDNKVTIKNRAQLNDSLYKMLNTENIAVYLIFTLVLIMVFFACGGAWFMIILDKKENLKTMASFGAEISDLRKIFLLQGILLSVVGGLIGVGIGSAIVLIQERFELVMITDTLAYPVVFSFQNLAIVMATIVSLGTISALIASSRVSKKLLV